MMEVHLISVNIYITKPQYKEHFEPETHSLITICKTDMNNTMLHKSIHMTEQADQPTWLVAAGQVIRSNFHIVSIIQFIPQTLLNLLVIISTLTTIYQSRINCKPVFIFILNQAVADFALAIVVVVVINLRYQPGDDIRNTHRKCHIQIGVWLWIVLISMTSTGILTLDRFLYITTTLQYNSIMTSTRVILALITCWMLPAVNAVFFFFTYK